MLPATQCNFCFSLQLTVCRPVRAYHNLRQWHVRCRQILSKDSVTVAVDAVVYYRVSNATISVVNVEDAARSTRLLAQTTLRTVLGTKNLSEILSDRENISHFMQVLHSPL